MNKNAELGFLAGLLSAIGIGERRGGAGRRTVTAPAKRPSRKSQSRRAKRAAMRAAGVGAGWPVDWRNPLMIGNRTNRRFAERHGLAAFQDRIVAGAEIVPRMNAKGRE